MRTVAIPTDFSENAFNALEYAAQLFKYEKTEFYLLHAYAEEVYGQGALVSDEIREELKQKHQREAQEGLQKLQTRILGSFPNPRHKFHTVASFGLLVDEVNHLVNKENIDICIMGTRGKTNDRKIAFGSNTLQVLKYLQCPVMSVPDRYSFDPPQKILFPTDYMIPFTRRELKLLSDIACFFSAEIHMLYISKTPLESLRQQDNKGFLEDQLKRTFLNFHTIDGQERVKTILDFSQKIKAGMLVMVNSRKTYLEDILYRSTLDKIGLDPKIPFLVLQNFHRD